MRAKEKLAMREGSGKNAGSGTEGALAALWR
jgi:hypothetical protein